MDSLTDTIGTSIPRNGTDITHRFDNMPGQAYSGIEPFIFVSYCHEDWQIVYPAVEMLMGKEYRVWYDDGIRGGDEWREVIQDRIERCEVFLPCVTARYCESAICRSEVSVADEEQKRIIPLFLENAKLTHGMRLLLPHKQGICKYEMPSDSVFNTRLRNLLPKTTRMGGSFNGSKVDAEQRREEDTCTFASEVSTSYNSTVGRMYYWAGRNHADNANGRESELLIAAKLYQKSYELGDPYGTCELGRCYRDGKGVQPDGTRAVTLAQKAAARPDFGGCFDMGSYYERGYHVAKDYHLAAQHYEAASACTPITAEQKAEALRLAIVNYTRNGEHEKARSLSKAIRQITECSKNAAVAEFVERSELLTE